MFLKDRNMIVTARASSGIYLVLSSLSRKGAVIVPGNLCYAAIYPVKYAGMTPVFCDVSPESGNTNLKCIQEAYHDGVVAAILPHMYGNPVEEMPEIVAFLHAKNVTVIEDCASAMGATADYPLGQMGDYTVYSTGHAKTLDLGFGGLLCSPFAIAALKEKERSLPLYSEEAEKEISFFSRLYRLLRNEGAGTEIEKAIFRELPEILRDSFLHRVSEEREQWLLLQLEKLDEAISLRREKYRRYEKKLQGKGIKKYIFSDGAVPFRFNFFVPENQRKRIIKLCLESGLPISDWYPSVTKMFGEEIALKGVDCHEAEILNLPLLLADERIDEICIRLVEIMEEVTKDET